MLFENNRISSKGSEGVKTCKSNSSNSSSRGFFLKKRRNVLRVVLLEIIGKIVG